MLVPNNLLIKELKRRSKMLETKILILLPLLVVLFISINSLVSAYSGLIFIQGFDLFIKNLTISFWLINLITLNYTNNSIIDDRKIYSTLIIFNNHRENIFNVKLQSIIFYTLGIYIIFNLISIIFSCGLDIFRYKHFILVITPKEILLHICILIVGHILSLLLVIMTTIIISLIFIKNKILSKCLSLVLFIIIAILMYKTPIFSLSDISKNVEELAIVIVIQAVLSILTIVGLNTLYIKISKIKHSF